MKNKRLKNDGPEKPIGPFDISFEDAMRKIVNTPKQEVDNALAEREKKLPRGKNLKRD